MNSKKKPNVIVFLTDQQRWDTSSLHGNNMNLMPNFEKMATNGTHFYNSFTCQPVCGPARSCIQSGCYATTTGVYKNGIHYPLDKPSLASYFNEEGYKTGYIGKWHLGGTPFVIDKDKQVPVPIKYQADYQYWLGCDLLEFSSRPYDTVLFDKEGNSVKLPGYRVDALTDEAIRYIDREKDNPFFLFLSFLEPHHQNTTDSFPPPDIYKNQFDNNLFVPKDLATLKGSSPYQLGDYYGMVKRLDDCLGRIFDALKSLKIDDNTIVVFASDHANHFKTRNAEYKRSCHESSIRIPVAACGGPFTGGGKFTHLFSLVDLAPTILDACNIKVNNMEGHSAIPIINRKSDTWTDCAFIQISESQIGRAIRTNKWKYSVENNELDSKEFNCAEEYTEAFLYDLESDPNELVNLVGMDVYRGISDELKVVLLNKINEIEHYIPKIIDAKLSKAPGQRVLDYE